MFIFFTIPLLVVFCIAVGLLGAFLNFLPDLMMYLFFITGAVLWMMSAAIAIQNSGSKPVAILSAVFGIAASFCAAQAFTQRGLRPAGFIIVFLLMSVVCLICYFLITSASSLKRVSALFMVIAISLLVTMWSVGYELSYTVKCDYYNVAYYQAIDSGAVLDDDDISIRLDSKQYHEHTIENYEVGDCYLPEQKEIPTQYAAQKSYDFLDADCYTILLDNGQTGYIFSGDMDTYYWSSSAFVDALQEKLRNNRWYGVLPNNVTTFCEALFERIPLFLSCKLVTSD